MDFLQIIFFATYAWIQTVLDNVVFRYAETIVALITIITAFVATVIWVWKKIVIPVGRAMSHISDMYSTHEFVLSEIAKMQGLAPLIKQHDDQHKLYNEKMTKAIERVDQVCSKANMIYEESPIARYECDMDGKCTWTNAALQKLWGMNSDQMLGYGWLSGLHPDDAKRVERDWVDTVKFWVPYRARYRIVHPETGHETAVETTAQVIHAQNNRPVCIWGKVVKAKTKKPKDEETEV